jgi:hypothetical protein
VICSLQLFLRDGFTLGVVLHLDRDLSAAKSDDTHQSGEALGCPDVAATPVQADVAPISAQTVVTDNPVVGMPADPGRSSGHRRRNGRRKSKGPLHPVRSLVHCCFSIHYCCTHFSRREQGAPSSLKAAQPKGTSDALAAEGLYLPEIKPQHKYHKRIKVCFDQIRTASTRLDEVCTVPHQHLLRPQKVGDRGVML